MRFLLAEGGAFAEVVHLAYVGDKAAYLDLTPSLAESITSTGIVPLDLSLTEIAIGAAIIYFTWKGITWLINAYYDERGSRVFNITKGTWS